MDILRITCIPHVGRHKDTASGGDAVASFNSTTRTEEEATPETSVASSNLTMKTEEVSPKRR